MSDAAADITPLNPVVRFRIRTILVATTGLAIAAAIAAPYWRLQTPAAQIALICYWLAVTSLGTFAGWVNWRRCWQLPPQAGPVVSVAWLAGRRRRQAAGSLLGMLLSLALLCAVVGSQSTVIVKRSDQMSAGGGIFSAALMGSCHGFMLGGMALYCLRRPVYLCRDMLGGAVGVPWKYIRHAEWLADRPGVMKLRRLDGDIFLDVPNNVRGEVEGFVRRKTQFVDGAPIVSPV